MELFDVTGKVSLRGAPLSDALVTFSPIGEGAMTAYGRSDSTGQFVLTTYDPDDGAPAGEYIVLVNKYAMASEDDQGEDAGHSDDPNADFDATGHAAQDGASGSDLVPALYGSKSASPLRASVGATGGNSFEFSLH